MINVRYYGKEPFHVAVIHGGPGALGSVVAIHGDYDPHPAEGIKTPLENVIEDFRFYLFKRCGHSPWKEQYAKNLFYKIIREEIDIN